MEKRSDVEVVIVGDELLKGERSDAHLTYMGRSLQSAGVRISNSHIVGDSVPAIADAVKSAVERARVVIVCGGLGPTEDDITRDGVAGGLGLELEFHEESWVAIEAFFAKRGRPATDNNRRQAHFPKGATVLGNGRGTAPGFLVEKSGATVFVLPGPPLELQPMFADEVLPRVMEMFGRSPLRVETFRTLGIGESQLVSLLGDALRGFTAYHLSSLPSMTGVDMVLTERAGVTDRTILDTEADEFARRLREGIGHKFYERGQRPLAQVVGDVLASRGETLGIAESLTGGLISKLLTDTPGSSAYLLTDVVSYSDASKSELLGVRTETLETHGAVSEETCTEMAHGIRRRSGATYGLSTTGIAGPTGGTARKPIGLVYLGIGWEGGSQIKRVQYPGQRHDIRLRAAFGALWLLFDYLQNL